MRILIDTNVALDVLLARKQFYDTSAQVLFLSEKDVIDGYISASAITDIYYVAYKAHKDKLKSISLIKKVVASCANCRCVKCVNISRC